MTKKEKRSRWLIFIIVLFMALVFVYPLFLIVMNSVKPLPDILMRPLALPGKVEAAKNYSDAIEEINILLVMKNTAILTILSVGGITILATMSAYWTCRFKNRYAAIFEKMIILSMLIPFASLMLPLVQVMHGIKLNSTMFGSVLTYWGIGLAFAYFMIMSAVKNVPIELEEAAMIDGCSRTKTFFVVVLPMLRPTILSLVVMDIFWIWNDFIVPLILMNNQKLMTVQLAISRLFGQYASKWNIALPALTLTMLPIVVLFILLQKKIMNGVIDGAVKG